MTREIERAEASEKEIEDENDRRTKNESNLNIFNLERRIQENEKETRNVSRRDDRINGKIKTYNQNEKNNQNQNSHKKQRNNQKLKRMKRMRRSVEGAESNVETLVVLDRSMSEHYVGMDLKLYVLTVMNMVGCGRGVEGALRWQGKGISDGKGVLRWQ